jgi:hypothetical protein
LFSAYNYFFQLERQRMLDARTYAPKKHKGTELEAFVTGFAPLAVAVAAEWRKVKATDPIRLQEVLEMAALDKARYHQEMKDWRAARISAAEPELAVDSVAKTDGGVHVTDEESLGDDESDATVDVHMTASKDWFGNMMPFTESGIPNMFVYSSNGRPDLIEGFSLEDWEHAFSQPATGSFGNPNILQSETFIGRISTGDNEYKSSTWKNHRHLGWMDSGGGDEDLDYEPFPLDPATTAPALQNWPEVGSWLAL